MKKVYVSLLIMVFAATANAQTSISLSDILRGKQGKLKYTPDFKEKILPLFPTRISSPETGWKYVPKVVTLKQDMTIGTIVSQYHAVNPLMLDRPGDIYASYKNGNFDHVRFSKNNLTVMIVTYGQGFAAQEYLVDIFFSAVLGSWVKNVHQLKEIEYVKKGTTVIYF